jgi:hypothetical protein
MYRNLKQDSLRYERYLTIKALTELPPNVQPSKELAAKMLSIDLKKDSIHLMRLCNQNNKAPSIVD